VTSSVSFWTNGHPVVLLANNYSSNGPWSSQQSGDLKTTRSSKQILAGHRERVRYFCCLLLTRAAKLPRSYLLHMDRNLVCEAIVIAGRFGKFPSVVS
jgi:hypothetical protein